MKLLLQGATVQRIGRPPRGGRGLKRLCIARREEGMASPPTRGAWIETKNQTPSLIAPAVAPHAGGVD